MIFQRRLLSLFLCLVSLWLGFNAWASHEKDEPSDGTVNSFFDVDPPRPLSPLSFTDANGGTRQLEAFRGRVVLVNLWASWCPPCLRELPALDRLQKTFGGREFVVVALSLDRKGISVAARTFRRLGIENLTLYTVPPEVVAEILPADVLPANFILNRQGKVTKYLRSYVDWDDHDAVSFIFDQITTTE